MPIYPLYALLFTSTGLSIAQVSALFAIWSAVAVLTEVPSGALADRFSRRGCLVAAGVLQAVGYSAWVLLPGFAGFAVGFVLWGCGGSLVTGALEALLYDGLVAVGAEDQYARVNGWVTAMELVAQFPAALAATLLFAAGGFPLAGWVSVGTCLVAAVLAARLPEPPRVDADDEPGYLETLRAGVAEAAGAPAVRAVLVAAAVLGAFDVVEEYFPLLLADWGVPTAFVPLADLPIVLAGVAGAALAGAAARLPPWALGAGLTVAMLLLGGAGLAGHPAGIAAVAVFYGGYRAVLVVVDARLQERITSRSRATVTSVASLGTELATFGLYAAWAVGGAPLLAACGLLIAVALPLLLRERPGAGSGAPGGRYPHGEESARPVGDA
ncbi:MFS transporter [Pseudonocardia sp. MH-G8]|nr:MFS transporter [Pseudonocardia sp. MH-G8]